MKVLICPDKFKESLSATLVAEHIRIGILKALPLADCKCIPMADGGEGTVEALVSATKGHIQKVKVHDPLMRPIDSFIGISGDGKTAFVEMAAASGLALLQPSERNPLITTTYGTGELIRHALDAQCEKIIIGIGGSATVDGGAGMARALGIRMTDQSGREIADGGRYLTEIDNIDISGKDPRLTGCKIYIASDVTNILHGPDGAAFIFGPQKGADESAVKILDAGLEHLGLHIKKQLKKDISMVPGSGAAGGLGAGMIAFLNGEIKSGFNLVAEVTGLSQWIDWADIIVTGEGRIDYQTLYGKTPAGVAKAASEKKKPVIAFAGSLGKGYNRLYNEGFTTLIAIGDGPMSLEESMSRTAQLIEDAAERTFRLFGKIN
jgi:glycerate kinase